MGLVKTCSVCEVRQVTLNNTHCHVVISNVCIHASLTQTLTSEASVQEPRLAQVNQWVFTKRFSYPSAEFVSWMLTV